MLHQKQVISPVTIKRRGNGWVAIDAMGETVTSGTGWAVDAMLEIEQRYGVDVVVQKGDR